LTQAQPTLRRTTSMVEQTRNSRDAPAPASTPDILTTSFRERCMRAAAHEVQGVPMHMSTTPIVDAVLAQLRAELLAIAEDYAEIDPDDLDMSRGIARGLD